MNEQTFTLSNKTHIKGTKSVLHATHFTHFGENDEQI